MKLKFEIKGKVKAKQSMKFTKEGRRYTPGDMVEYSNLVKMSFINAYPAWNAANFSDKPLNVSIFVYMPIPKSFSQKKKQEALEGKIRPIVKPDCDNIAKNINDALNGIAYPDDKQISCLTVSKYYADSESVTVEIENIKE